jgi:hypothetical protein
VPKFGISGDIAFQRNPDARRRKVWFHATRRIVRLILA